MTTENISENLKTELLNFHRDYPEKFYITGSFSLILFGIIDRKVNDLDFALEKEDFLNLQYELTDISVRRYLADDVDSQTVLNITANPNCKIDIFLKDNRTNWEYKEVFGVNFRVIHPFFSIQAKLDMLKYLLLPTNYLSKDNKQKYLANGTSKEKVEKHLGDIVSYKQWLIATNENNFENKQE
jgi:hypothetical protein